MTDTTDITLERIDETLARYRELQSQFERVRDRLRMAEEHRHTVNRRVYERVRNDYDRELDAIRASMSPLREALESTRARFEVQLREVDARLAAQEDELAELTFRHRVGEVNDDALTTRRAEMNTRIDGVRGEAAALRETLATLDAMQNPDHVGVRPAETAAPQPEDLADDPAPEPVAERRPVLRTARPVPPGPDEPVTAVVAPMVELESVADLAIPELEMEPAPVPVAPAFENPHDWIDEIGRDLTHGHRASEPKPAPASSATATATQPPVPARLPSLVFVSGVHAGQSIPLLPTTLTIGREHDNNIEIKDADVARYHARILCERGRYVIEDMESTTGTWVNGQRARRTILAQGDVIRVGQTELAIDFEWTAGTRSAG